MVLYEVPLTLLAQCLPDLYYLSVLFKQQQTHASWCVAHRIDIKRI